MVKLRVRRKIKRLSVICALFIVLIYMLIKTNPVGVLWDFIFRENVAGPCNTHLVRSDPGMPVIGLLGPPGSGVHWLRYLIEQMTGIYTGSMALDHPEIFNAEGKVKKVVAIAAHKPSDVPGIRGGIVLYRSLKDTVRSFYAATQGRGAFLEAPLQAYYGHDWASFAEIKSRSWVESYLLYMKVGVPLLIINYNDLEDPERVKTQLLRISNFLHVPIKSSMLECVVERAQEFPLKPKPLRGGFQPYSLLSRDTVSRYEKLQNDIDRQLQIVREKYKPKVR